jgi:hypothetical protein
MLGQSSIAVSARPIEDFDNPNDILDPAKTFENVQLSSPIARCFIFLFLCSFFPFLRLVCEPELVFVPVRFTPAPADRLSLVPVSRSRSCYKPSLS